MAINLRSLKFSWEYFVLGKHRVGINSPEDFAKKLDWHEDALVGRYVHTDENWWSDTSISGLDYTVRLGASGEGPTPEQIEKFEMIILRLHDLISSSNLEPPPKDDGWGNPPPPFDINSAPISSITMKDDGGYFLFFEVDPDDVYMLAPSFEISPDMKLLLAEWNV